MNLRAKGLIDSLKSDIYTPLAIYLMEQKKDPDSHWAAYLAAMNPDLSNHLIFWTEEEL